MEGLTIFKLLFGNVLTTTKWLKDLTSSAAVGQINEVFYNSFQKVLRSHKDSIAIRHLLRLERKKIISFFEVETQNNITFKELLSSEMLSKLSNVLYGLFDDEKYRDHIDIEHCKEIVSDTIKNFQQEIYNQLSEKQGIYIILRSVIEQEETLNQIIARLAVSKEEIIDTVKNSESAIVGKVQSVKDELGEILVKREKDIALEALEPVIKDIYKEACDLANNYDYTKAIKKFRKAIKLYKKYESRKNQTFYNIYTNMAFCYEREPQPNHKKAAKFLIKALKYNKDNPKAIYQAYLGHDTLGDETAKSKLKKKLVTGHKNSPECLLLLLFLSKTDNTIDVQPLEKEGIENFPDDLEVQYAIARVYLEKGNSKKYRTYMYRAIKLAPDNGAFLLKPLLAFHLSHSQTSIFHSYKTKTFSAEVKKDLHEAIKLYKESWEYLKEKPNNKIFANRPVNISAIYASLQNYDEAIKWIDTAISSSNEDYFIVHKVMYLRYIGRSKEAIQEVSKIKDIFGSQMDGTFITYLELLFNDTKENKTKAIKLAYAFLDRNSTSPKYRNVVYFLAIMLVIVNRVEEAISFIKKQIEKDSDNPKLQIALSKAYLANGNQKKANAALELALESEKNKENESFEDINFLFELGSHLFDIKRYEEAALILEKISSPNHKDSLNGALLNCYKELGQLDKALNLCKGIRISKGPHRFFTSSEVSILVQNTDYRTALPIAEEYYEKFPDDKDIRLDLCNLYLTTGQRKNAESLDLHFPIEELSGFRQVKNLVVLLNALGRRTRIFELIYQLWKKKKSAEVCEFILTGSIFLQVTKEELKIEAAKPPCAIFLKNEDSDAIEEYVLLNEEYVDYDTHREINGDNPLFNLMKGKKIGDVITVKQGLGYNSEMEVVDIRTIYQYAVMKSGEAIATQYKGQTPTIAMRPKDAETGVKQIFKMIDQLSKNQGLTHAERCRLQNEDIKKYCKLEAPLGSMKKLLGYPLIALWYHFTENPNIGIRSVGGSLQEMKSEYEILSNFKKGQFCIDLASLLTLFHTGVADSITEVTGKFHIAQSTVDLIEQILNDRDSVMQQSNWHIIFYEDDGKSVRHQTSKERHTQLWHDLEKISQWIKDYCELPEPARLRLSTSKEEEEQMSLLLSHTFFDTSLLAKEKEYILIADDYLHKVFSVDYYRLKAVSSFSLFKYLRDASSNADFKNACNKAIITLIKLNYKFIGPDPSLMLYAADDDDLFKLMLRYFNPKMSDGELALKTAYYFFKILWSSNLQTAICSKRVHEVLNQLCEFIKPQFVYEDLTNVLESVGVGNRTNEFKESLEQWWKAWNSSGD